jgi:hypothetical protein
LGSWGGALTLLLLCALAAPVKAKPPTNPTSSQIPQITKNRIQASFLRAPLHFEANQGQTDEHVKFLARGSGYTLFLTSTEAVLTLREHNPKNQVDGSKVRSFLDRNPKSEIENPKSAVVRMKLVGANPKAEVVGLEQLPGKVNYFIGNDPKKWRTNIPTYAKVQYQAVYPRVNLVYYGNQRQLEYDFVISPGADPSTIKLAFEGGEKIEIDAQGDLILHTTLGDLRLHKPLVYQVVGGIRKEVSAAYVLSSDSEPSNPKSKIENSKSQVVGFRVAAYDASKPLVIDPVLSYSTYLGGSGPEEESRAIAVDAAGNAYVTGFTASVDFPTLNPFQAFNSGGEHGDAFVTKLNPSGSLVYSTYLGGSGGDFGSGIALEPGCAANCDVYIMGGTCSTNFPTMSPLQAALAGGCDTFVTKLNAIGSALIYSTYLGGSGNDGAHAIAVDSSGKAHVTGYTHSSDFPTVNAFQPFYSGHRDSFVAKLNSEGSVLIYSSYLGGNSVAPGTTTADDETNSIALDSSGNAYITGGTSSTNFPTKNPFQASHGGGAVDAFVTKVDATGSLVFSTYLGGNGHDRGDGIAIDSSGNAYITGTTNSTNFPTANALQASKNGGADAFVTKLSADGSVLVYSTYLGGSGDEDALDVAGIAVDSSGNAYVTGRTFSTTFPTVNPLQAANSGDSDVFVAKLNTGGSALVFSTYLGGSGSERTAGIAVDAFSNVYVVGRTSSTDFPLVNPSQPVNAGGFDVFVAKLDLADITPAGNNVLVRPIDSTSGTSPVTVTFSTVTQAGTTSVTTSSTGTPPPSGFKLGNPPTYYELTTTAVFTGSVTICINYAGVSFGNESNLKLFHLEGGTWVDRTISLDTADNVICANVTSLSAFAIFERLAIAVTIDIKPGSFPNSINLGSGGTVPVAIFSTASFDSRTVDRTSVTLASAPVKLTGKGTPMSAFEDVNGDGLLDQIVHVETSALQLSEADTEAVLEGKTSGGTPIRGTDTVRVVP